MTLTEAGQALQVNGDAQGFPERIADRVTIVGFADGHRELATNRNGAVEDGMEFWGLNRLHAVLPDRHWTRWFELHDLRAYYGEGDRIKDHEHIEWLKGSGVPVYVRPEDMMVALEWGITNAVPFPKRAVLDHFPPYFTNSVSWLLALGVGMEFTEMRIFGVDMAQDQILQKEYREQRPSCEYFLGVASASGIEVILPPASDLLRATHLYGFERDEIRSKLDERLKELAQRKERLKGELAQLDGHRTQLIGGINQLDGAMQEQQYLQTNLMASKEPANG